MNPKISEPSNTSTQEVDSSGDHKNKPPITPQAIHLLRTIHMHNVVLSSVADRKANFLLGATFVSLSIVMSTGVKDMQITLAVMLGFSILVASLAVLAIVPKYKLSHGISHHECLFFFGSFAERNFEDFYNDVDEVIRSEDKVHKALCRDMYGIGKVLMEKKYFYLSWSYRVFIVALLVIPLTLLLEKNL